MASSTCELPTLPEEQAEPLLTATPSRSSAMSWVAAKAPGRRMQLVLGSRRPQRRRSRLQLPLHRQAHSH